MRIRDLTFLPTGEVLTDEAFDTAGLSIDALEQHATWWRAAGWRAETSVDTLAGRLALKVTFGAEGQALGTWSLSGKPVLSSLLLAGIDPVEDAALTKMFRDSMRNIKHVTQPEGGQAPFERIQEVTERPLAVGVFWRFTPLMQYQRVIPTIRLITAALFRARPAGDDAVAIPPDR
jgi:hypothetical protein